MKTSHAYFSAIILAIAFLFDAGSPVFASSPTDTDLPTINKESSSPLITTVEDDDPIKSKKRKKRRNSWMPVRLFEQGQWDARLSVGTVPTYLMDGAQLLIPPVQAGLDYRISRHFSIGATAGHSMSKSQPKVIGDGVSATWTNSTTFVAIRPGVHINKIENWDFYGGFSLGANFIQIDGNSSMSEEQLLEMESHLGIVRSKADFAFTGFTGFRRVISPRWTVGAEIGSGISLLTVGASFKFSRSKTDPSAPVSAR